MLKKQRGFTLIEAIVAVAIIGIIATIAWPMYESQSKRSNRTDGSTALLIAVNEMERCYSDTPDYTGCAITATSPNGKYGLAISASTSETFTITATPTFSDADCTTMTINNLGQKGYTGAAPSMQRCWSN